MHNQFRQINKISIFIAIIGFISSIVFVFLFNFNLEIGQAVKKYFHFTSFTQISIPFIAVLLTLIVTLIFSNLKIIVSKSQIEWHFGLGFWNKKILIKDIQSVKIVRNKWWYGWGIRKYQLGWLYNVSGLDAIELHLKNGKHIRLGTNDPKKLQKAIQKNRDKLRAKLD